MMSNSSFGNVYIDRGGTVTGSLKFGEGKDLLVLMSKRIGVGNLIDGGAGVDRIELATSSTYAAPIELEGNRLLNFERLTNTTGVSAYSGSLAVNVDVNGGYLFGRTGSLLTGNVVVGSGARFGSAGLSRAMSLSHWAANWRPAPHQAL